MATDFTNNNKTISASGGLQPTTINTPLDVRTRVNLKADIDSIPNPFVGMKILVLQDETNNNEMTEYVVVSLKADSLGIANAKINEVVLTKDFLGVNGNGITDEQAQQLNTAYTHSQSTHVQQSDIPTKTSQLTNDSDFATNASVDEKIANASTGGTVDLSSYAKKTDLPTKTSQLTNDSGFITSIPSEYVTEQELNTGLSAKANKSEIPTKTSQLTNDSGFLTQHQDISGKVDKISGKGLSTNDYTTEEKNKLNGIEENANNYSLPMASSTVLGGIKVGNGLSIDSNGVLSSNTPSLESNTLTFGNYTITYNETDDTLDFIYNGTTEEPEVPPTIGDYVSEGLSLYIDASDAATYGSVRDITGKQNITNHGVSTTLDNNYLNFVTSESDYIDTGLVPNLSTWSAEIYFYYTAEPTSSEVICSWGSSTNNRIRLGYSNTDNAMKILTPSGADTFGSGDEFLTLRHVVVTGNSGVYTLYIDGTKRVTINNTVLSSHTGTLKIGTDLNASGKFTNMNLKSFRFYDGKVLSDAEVLQNYNYELKNNYVTEGLSMYIDAKDAATYDSVRDITGNHTVTNHGASLTSDNEYLNFISTESDYLDTNLVPNLSTWSAELYFHFTATLGADTQVILGWGESGSKMRIGYSDSAGALVVQSNNETNYTIANVSDLLSPHHLIVTMNNGALTSYLDGVKTVLCTSGGIQTSHTGTLKIGCKYNGTEQFANINLRMFRFYDGKVLSDEEALRNYNYELKNTYVTEGLSMYIDASDVTTYGSIRDIAGNQTVTNNGASLTSDNKYLNFVSSESDYLDTNLVPNLSTWSAEVYFHYTSMPTSTEVVVGWGKAGDNNIRIAYSASSDRLAVQSNGGTNYELLDGSEILSLHHIIITMNNGSITSYVDGIKAVLCTDATVQSSHDGTLKIGSRYSGTKEFANINLRMFRFYDGKVLTDEEALQNYNYEINRG